MGKPTGFLEFQRELPADRSASGRVADWKEFHHHLPEADLKKAGRALHGLRHSVLPHRPARQRHGQRLPDSQL
jgi:hypothetical protein